MCILSNVLTPVLDEIGRQLVPSKVQTSYMVNDVNVPTLMGVQKKHISGLDVQPLEVLMNYIRAWASKEGQSATLGKLISILERAEYGCLVHYIQQLIPEDEQTTAHSTTSAFNVEEQNGMNYNFSKFFEQLAVVRTLNSYF